MRIVATATFWLSSALASPVMGQSDWTYERLSRDEEIALARSAAPSSVSDDAEIWVLVGEGYKRAVAGTNGNSCIVVRGSYPSSLLPTCYDAEATRTVLPLEFREFELQLSGMTRSELEEIVGKEIAAGDLPMPTRPAMAYMMSSGQRLPGENDDLGPWLPHLMFYMPFSHPRDIGLDSNTDHVMVINAGRPQSFLMVIVPTFSDGSTPRSR